MPIVLGPNSPLAPLNHAGLALRGQIILQRPKCPELHCYQFELPALMLASERQRIEQLIYSPGVPVELQFFWEIVGGKSIAVPISWCREVALCS